MVIFQMDSALSVSKPLPKFAECGFAH
jgi:hypothetical protein